MPDLQVARRALQHFGRNVADATDARGPVEQFARLRLGLRHQLLHYEQVGSVVDEDARLGLSLVWPAGTTSPAVERVLEAAREVSAREGWAEPA